MALGQFRGSVVAVTGASSGVGRAVAHAFARRGASLGLIARSEESLRAALAEVEELGGRGIVIAADVADAAALDAAAERIERELGPIQVWVNNAMVTVLSPVDRMSGEEFQRVTAVTYLGTVHGTLAALRRMRPREAGTIVQVGSALAYRSIPLQSAYCAAKAAIRGFTDSLRAELIHDRSRVRVTMVQLPAVNTPQFEYARNKMPNRPRPVPPVFDPDLIAESIVYATVHAPRELNVGGSTLQAIAAQRLAPGVADRILAARAYKAQQTLDPDDPDRPDNLFQTVPGDHGTDGPFSAESKDRSLQLTVRARLGPLPRLVALAAGAALVAAAARRARRWSRTN